MSSKTRNGPYGDKETPLREKLFRLNNLLLSNNAGEAIIVKRILEIYSDTSDLTCLKFRENKTPTNGVLGFAWLLETMCLCYDYLSADQLKALRVLVSKFRIGEEGTYVIDGVRDKTMNHQIWLFYSLVFFYSKERDVRVLSLLNQFNDSINQIVRIRRNGRFAHYVKESYIIESLKYLKLKFRKGFLKSRKLKEAGYHCFTLYAFARIYQLMPSLINKEFITKALEYPSTREFALWIEAENDKDIYDSNTRLFNNPYGYPYNLTGFELKFVSRVFDIKYPSQFYSRQLEIMNNLPNGTDDALVVELRMYQFEY